MPSLKTSQRSWTAVATLLTFCPPGPLAAMKLSLSASSGIVKSSEADIAEPGTDESRRQRRGRFYRRLALALHPNGQGVEQHRAFAGAIDGIARNRDADPFGGVDTQLVGSPCFGREDDDRATLPHLGHAPVGDGGPALRVMDHPPAFLRARHLAERQVDPALHSLGPAVPHRHLGLRPLLLPARPLAALVGLGAVLGRASRWVRGCWYV